MNSDRITTILKNDLLGTPERILPSLKSEIKSACKNYLNLSGDIVLRYRYSDEGIIFFTEIPANSVKNMFRL